jgi:hypothetical protein
MRYGVRFLSAFYEFEHRHEGAIAVEKKIFASLIIALMVGLAGGYTLNYVIYQPQIQNLRNDLGTLNAKLENYQNAINDLEAAVSNLNAIVKKSNSTSQSNATSQTPPSNESTFYENLEFLSANATKIGTNFEIDFSLQNTGTSSAVLAELSLDGIPQDGISDLTSIIFNGTTYSKSELLVVYLNPGDAVNGTLTLMGGVNFVSGMSVELTLWTARENYPIAVILPQ